MPDAKPAHLTFPQPDRHHLAQLNFATAIADLDDPVMAGFVDALAVVNGIAERSQGFVWRIKDSQEAAAQAIVGDRRETFTMSLWESAADLEFFAWNTVHRRFMKDRHSWFRPPSAPFLVMWWLPAGTIPAFTDALARLARLREEGPSEAGFGWDNLEGPRAWQTAGPPPL
jgi:hypothetical protein